MMERMKKNFDWHASMSSVDVGWHSKFNQPEYFVFANHRNPILAVVLAAKEALEVEK